MNFLWIFELKVNYILNDDYIILRKLIGMVLNINVFSLINWDLCFDDNERNVLFINWFVIFFVVVD